MDGDSQYYLMLQCKPSCMIVYVELISEIPISAGLSEKQNKCLNFNVHKSSSLACIGALSNTVNHHPYQDTLLCVVRPRRLAHHT